MKSLLVIAIGFSLTFALNACSTTPEPTQDPQAGSNDTVAQDQESFVERVNPYVKVDSGGQFVLEARASTSLNADDLDRVSAALKAVNQEIASGLLIASSDGSLLLPGAGLLPQANANGWKLYWWGFRLALDATRTRRVIGALRIGAGAGTLISFIPTPPTVIGGRIVAALLGIGSGALGYCNAAGYGVYIYRSWIGASWCRSQPR